MENKSITVVCDNNENYEKFDTIQTVFDAWYFHGKLEKDLGYDIGSVMEIDDNSIEDFDWDGHALKKLKLDGIYKVNVLDVKKPCIGYFWQGTIGNHTCQRGLIVYDDDNAAKKFAINKYNKKDNIL